MHDDHVAQVVGRWGAAVAGILAYMAASGLLMEHEVHSSHIALAFSMLALVAGYLAKRLRLVVIGAVAFAAFAIVNDAQAGFEVAAVMLGLLAGLALRRALRRSGPGHRQAPERIVRAQQAVALPRALRGLLNRNAIDSAIDLARLRLDVFPHGLYQPVTSLPIAAAKRADGCRSRWEAMRPVIEEHRPRSAVDIGANAGYFSIELAAAGVPTTAIESDPALYRTALLAVRRSKLPNVAVTALELRPDTMALLPQADVTVCLSVWHHFARFYGVDHATGMLRDMWSRTDKVLFFETGENEMPPAFDLPDMSPDTRAWLHGFLRDNCEHGNVRFLGLHDAFDAGGYSCRRHLFAVVRANRLSPPPSADR